MKFEVGKNGVKPKYEIFSSPFMFDAVDKAIELGWAENKVQVRLQLENNKWVYSIEPYDGCGCRNLLKYEDFAPKEAKKVG